MNMMGKLLYALGIGLITIIIRFWGALSEGISFAIIDYERICSLTQQQLQAKAFGVVAKTK